jgi:hypothetical protein
MQEVAQLDIDLAADVRDKNLKADQEAADLMHQKQLDYIAQEGERRKAFMGMMVDSMYQAFDVFNGINENQQIKLDNAYAKEKERIENSTLSKQEQQKQLDALDEKTAKNKRKLNRKAAAIDKATGIMSVGISTAQAIMKAFATLAYPLNIVAAAFAGAMGVAQTAVIASKPLPEAEKGAFLPGSADGTALIAGEKRKPEIILPLDIGVGKLATALVGKIGEFGRAASSGVAASMAGGGGMNLTVNVGNFIGNRSALREFEETVNGLRIERIDRRA